MKQIDTCRAKILNRQFLSCFTSTCSCRFLSNDVGATKLKTKKYSESLLLPSTEFPIKISAEKRKEHEIALASKLQFDELYNRQLIWRKDDPEFILHDGPPYANGHPHLGHAVNKILKDIVNRYKLLRGYRINYVPGWDCHGLPIELKALKSTKLDPKTDALNVRKAAREVAKEWIGKQKSAFKRWGVMADWDAPYHTFDKGYIQSQFSLFYDLHEKNFVYRDLKPIHYSPSSRSALAEAEVEYNEKHESPSIILKIRIEETLRDFSRRINREVSGNSEAKIEALVWTTTPWTLPGNEAIAFNERENYTLVSAGGVYFIVASPLLSTLSEKYHLESVAEFPGKCLEGLKYEHPWFRGSYRSFYHANHVVMDKGTGLVHTAPAHGALDYYLGLQKKLPITNFVDDDGNFDAKLETLKGLSVLGAGNKKVIEELKSSLLEEETVIHSYPYDWRTKKPLITKASLQWFIDTDKLKEKALEALDTVNIFPKNVVNGMVGQLVRRPYWCISRQRVWGTPIPAIYHKDSKEPLVDKRVIENLSKVVEEKGNVDFWWEEGKQQLFLDEELSQNYTLGKDIFDIWFDSGISWKILNGKQADLYLEGTDQFNGWFQSSLLTSVALNERAPYKNLYVHGFVVDENERKMSKSVGNVLDPANITDNKNAVGTDVLRWWVATQGGTDGSNISMSTPLLRGSDEAIGKLRNVLRFLLGFCNERALAEIDLTDLAYDELMYIDQFMLHKLSLFQKEITKLYDEHNYNRVMHKILHFATKEVSANYFTWIKDRMYCDPKESGSRKSCLFVLNEIYETLSIALAPVLPFLIEEAHSHYSLKNESVFKSRWFDIEDKSWENTSIEKLFELVLDMNTTLFHIIGSRNSKELVAHFLCTDELLKELEVLHPMGGSLLDRCESELCDVFQVSRVELGRVGENWKVEPIGVGHSDLGYGVSVGHTEMGVCGRCRKYCCEDSILCKRCAAILKQFKKTPDKKTPEKTSTAI